MPGKSRKYEVRPVMAGSQRVYQIYLNSKPFPFIFATESEAKEMILKSISARIIRECSEK